jgi:hypothetical protein
MPPPPENIYTKQRRAHEAYQRQLKRVEQFKKMRLPAYNESLQPSWPCSNKTSTPLRKQTKSYA